MATLEVRALSRSYEDEVVALREASFTVADGRIAAILGPSGCGKTTLLRLVAGLDQPESGDVLLGDRSILRRPPHERGVGLMFQDLALFPHMNVRDNIAFGLRMQGWPERDRAGRVEDLLEAVGLTGKADRRVHELSGGEQQRVAMARTLAPQPAVLLLDEPLGSLDEALKASLRHELRAVLKRLSTTAVIVSHDLRDAVAMADDLVVMQAGRVLQAGPLPEVLSAPASIEVAEMVGYVPLLWGEVRDGRIVEEDVGEVALPHDFAPASRAAVLAHPSSVLGVPPETDLGCGVGGTVVRARAHGPMFLLDVAIGNRQIEVRWEWDLVPPEVGSFVDIAARPGTLRFFELDQAAHEVHTDIDDEHRVDGTRGDAPEGIPEGEEWAEDAPREEAPPGVPVNGVNGAHAGTPPRRAEPADHRHPGMPSFE